MNPSLSGLVCIRQGIELDYCWRESIQSLLPICSQVIVCDGESTDGTQELIRDWMKDEPKIALCVYPWPDPVGVPTFWVDWLQYGRQHCQGDFVIQLDADEVLSENSYDELDAFTGGSLWCKRYNFWRDDKNLIPHGVCCSHRVVRVIPKGMFLPSDGEDARGHGVVAMARDSGVEIFHYGFIRKPEAFFKKARALQGYFFNTYDQRLADAEATPETWMETIKNVEWINSLVPFTGKHPVIMKQWLKERVTCGPVQKAKPARTKKRKVGDGKVPPSD